MKPVELVVVGTPDAAFESAIESVCREGLAHRLKTITAPEQQFDSARKGDAVCICLPSPPAHSAAVNALECGMHVFTDGCPTFLIQDLRQLIALEERQDRFVVAGLPDVARSDVIVLKHHLCEGDLGPLRAIHAHGRVSLQDDGTPKQGILDGLGLELINVALYLAGDAPYEFALPASVQAECYRTRPEGPEDTVCLRAQTTTGVELCIHATGAAEQTHPRQWRVIGDRGVATLVDGEGVRFPGCSIPPHHEPDPKVLLLERLIEVIQGSDEPLLMPLAELEGAVLALNGTRESTRQIITIPESYQHRTETTRCIEHIDTVLVDAAISGRLLSQCGLPWAETCELFDLNDYRMFPRQLDG